MPDEAGDAGAAGAKQRFGHESNFFLWVVILLLVSKTDIIRVEDFSILFVSFAMDSLEILGSV